MTDAGLAETLQGAHHGETQACRRNGQPGRRGGAGGRRAQTGARKRSRKAGAADAAARQARPEAPHAVKARPAPREAARPRRRSPKARRRRRREEDAARDRPEAAGRRPPDVRRRRSPRTIAPAARSSNGNDAACRTSNARNGSDDRRTRLISAARTGHDELAAELAQHTEASPELTAGDVDARWQDAYAVGDEAPGGDNPTPGQDRVDDIGRALGINYRDDEELRGGEEVTERDRHRWELDPASSDDWPEGHEK